MNILLTVLFMTAIGALIGGFTNHLAIKMLFRPHEAKYIGNWRVPFTPGLIPKRRDELARQLGRTVVEHLLTPETFRRKFFSPEVKTKTENWMSGWIHQRVFAQPKSILHWLELAGVQQLDEQIEQKMDEVISNQLSSMKERWLKESLQNVLPENWKVSMELKVPEVSTYIIDKGKDYFASEEGRLTIKKLIDDFLSSKGTLGNMIQMFVGDSQSLVGKVQNEVQKFLAASGTHELLTRLLTEEWRKLLNRPLEELVGSFDFDTVERAISSYAKEQVRVPERLNEPITTYWKDAPEWTAKTLIPQVSSFAFAQAEQQLEQLLHKMKIEDMVKEQVDSLEVMRLEELVLGISKREFKMITVLGAVLGGLIGIIQGLIVLLLN